MRNALFALAILVPAPARADDRPYALVNGRSAGAAATAAPRAPAPAPAPAAAPQTSVAAAPATEQRSTTSSSVVCTSGSQAAIGRRASGGRPQGHKSFWSGKRSATEDLPPHFSKPGALIRTEGQQPQYAKAEAARTHAVEGGSFIDIDNGKAQDIARAPSLQWGPKDTLPTVNPVSGNSSSGDSITPNSTTNITNNTTNGNQDGGSGKDDKHDNSDFGGGTGFDPAF